MEIATIVKKYERDEYFKTEESEDDTLYSLSEILTIYPSLSTYLITKAINEGKLNVKWLGNRRYFYKKDILEFINSSSEKDSNNWRTRY